MNIVDFSDAAIVMAHPDDEVLWSGSLVALVGCIVLCYGHNPKKPERHAQRLSVVRAYPYPGVKFLDLVEPRDAPVPKDMRVEPRSMSELRRESEALELNILLKELKFALRGAKVVFTHNPWGEYGHVDHRRVNLAVNTLAPELGYAVYTSCYLERRSMLRYGAFLTEGIADAISLPLTQSEIDPVVALYKQHACWTWNANWIWPKEEHFLRFGRAVGLSAPPAPLPLLLFDSGW